jgi:hypothetical protein
LVRRVVWKSSVEEVVVGPAGMMSALPALPVRM